MNTTELISALKIHGSFPTSNDLFSDADFLSLFNHQMLIEVCPLMLQLNEEYFLQYKDFTITAGSTYRVPTRAIGSNIRTLFYVDGSGNETPLVRLFEEDRPKGASGFYMLRNSIELSNDYTSGTLRMKYLARASKLVLTTACAQISSINTATNTVVVSSAPSTFANGTVVDFVQNLNPYDLLGMDYSLSSISGTTLTFASLPDDLVVGDWICLATESPVPMIPEELHPVLIQSALCKTLSSKKDKQYEQEFKVLERVIATAINMLDPRVKDSSTKMRTGALLGVFSRRY